jgi:phage terminase large subunit-like protein
MSARKSPLMLVISTAGFDLGSPLGKMYMQGLRIDGHRINGERKSAEENRPAFGMSWYGPTLEEMKAKGWKYKDPAEWERVNPAWSIFPSAVEDFEAAAVATHEASFIRYKLNGWTSSGAAFLPAGAWSALEDKTKKLEKGDEIILGFDGAWKGDSTGLCAIRLSDMFVSVLGHWEAPANDPDWRTPADEVEKTILEAMENFVVRELVADPWRFEQSLLRLQEEHGAPLVEFPSNSRARIIPATNGFYARVMEGVGGLSHDGDPALARHLGNAQLKETPMGALISKEYRSSSRHIDLAVALIIGMARASRWHDEAPASDDSLLMSL